MTHPHKWLMYLIGSLLAAITLVIIYIVYLLLGAPEPRTSLILEPDDAYNGITKIDPPLSMPDFTLTNQFNVAVQLRNLSDKPILMTFGFTNCPDICPLTLGEMRNIYENLGNLRDEIYYVFVSVDGERDVPAILGAYFEMLRVNSFVMGLTAAPEAVREISAAYGVDFVHHQADESGNYTVDHTAGMFLLNSENRWIRRYSYGTLSTLIVEDIQQVLSHP